MSVEHLNPADRQILDALLRSKRIQETQLPAGISVGLDSMGPMRDPIKDSLYPGVSESLDRFCDTLRRHRLTLVVATNGPDIEGEDILRSLSLPVAAYAITEGGGKLVALHPSGALEYTVLVDEEELKKLVKLEEAAKQHPLMEFLLEDKEFNQGRPPIRTPYTTNIVLTLPSSLDELDERAKSRHLVLKDAFPGLDHTNYVDKVLSFAHAQYSSWINQFGLEDEIVDLIKKQNRRIYVLPRHAHLGGLLSKSGGAEVGSGHLQFVRDYKGVGILRYKMEDSIYIADKVVDVGQEGQDMIGASERNMIVGGLSYYFGEPPDSGANVVKLERIGRRGSAFIAEVASRMAVNVTLDQSLPRFDRIEGVPILHIASGLKALEAISHLYSEIYK